MRQKRFLRGTALALALTLTLAPAASAITVDEARELLSTHYIDAIPEGVLELPTIDEITTALGDPYTYFMTAEEYAAFQADLNDTAVVGIGVMIEKLADGLKVILFATESPAQEAGLKIGDVIVAVDGTTIEEAGTPDALAALVTGEAGTKVTVTVRREGETFDATMTRREVVFPTATGEVVDGHIGWITVSSFGENTGEYFEQYITEEDDQADRWVVDLRGNPGGYGGAAIASVGYVLGNRDVAYLFNKQLERQVWRPNPFPVEIPGLIQEPMIVIVDGDSASASELFSAAVRDYDHGLIIGTRTFGKGVAQDVFENEDGSAMKITTNRYYSPLYVTPDRTGVLPNLVVDPNLADGVARLLSGKVVEKPGSDVLVLELIGQKWYVHKDEATSEAYSPAFAQLMAAIAPNTPMTLDGKATTPDAVAKAWKADYESRYFSDVADSPYAGEINTLAALGVVNGDENGNFNPKGELTRAELAAFLTQAMGYWCWESQGHAPYGDVSREDWFAISADILYNLGLMKGDELGHFNPNDLIDHQQFITVLMRAGAQTDMTIRQRMDDVGLTGLYEERPELLHFSTWAQPAAAVAEELGQEGYYEREHGVLTQSLKDMDPSAVVTREEAAAMLYYLMDYSGIIAVPETAK